MHTVVTPARVRACRRPALRRRTEFAVAPSWLRLPGIVASALRG
ncbi:hypothetical protein [Tsukamurella sp. TY48]|nr:hypothetical protein [Tsukamurella sp. TY48]